MTPTPDPTRIDVPDHVDDIHCFVLEARIIIYRARIAFFATRIICYAPTGANPNEYQFGHAVRMVADTEQDLQQTLAAQACLS